MIMKIRELGMLLLNKVEKCYFIVPCMVVQKSKRHVHELVKTGAYENDMFIALCMPATFYHNIG